MPSLFVQNYNYAGVFGVDVEVTNIKFVSLGGRVMSLHYAESLHRTDMRQLGESFVENGLLDAKLLQCIYDNKERMFDDHKAWLLSYRAASGTPV
jgi:hypothetical protein